MLNRILSTICIFAIVVSCNSRPSRVLVPQTKDPVVLQPSPPSPPSPSNPPAEFTNPPPQVGPTLTSNPTAIRFTMLTVNQLSPSQSVTIRNTGDQSATSFSLTIPSPFQAVNGTCLSKNQLAAGESCTVDVAVLITSTATVLNYLLVNYNNRQSRLATLVTGTVLDPKFSASSIQFGNVLAGNRSSTFNVIFTNIGGSAGKPSISNSQANSVFALVSGSNTCDSGGDVAPGATCQVSVTASPTVDQYGAIEGEILRVAHSSGGTESSIGQLTVVEATKVAVYQARQLISGLLDSYYITTNQSEIASLGYQDLGKFFTLYTSAWNSVCSAPLYRGDYIDSRGYHHSVVSRGGEPALSSYVLLGYICTKQTPYTPTDVQRFDIDNGAGGIWKAAASDADKSLLSQSGWTLNGSVGWSSIPTN